MTPLHLDSVPLFYRLRARAKPVPPVPDQVWQKLSYFFAFGLGSGVIPVAPGTFGTLMAIPFYLIVRPLSLIPYLIFLVCFIIFSSLLSERVSKEINIHDHPGMCIDEFAGFFVTMIHAPHGIKWICLGFVLFRFFDIVKPFPIRWLDQNIGGGFGMILDDVAAGLLSCLIIQLIYYCL